jgi:diadenosine tetraphosphate (Ap4A) HIT family hydrolase
MNPTERIASLAEGRDPKFVDRLSSGIVTMAENQYLAGYCLLLADPLVSQLNDLSARAQAQFLADMAFVGEVVRNVTGASRINYAIYGNVDPFLHAHIWPRYTDEPDHLRTLPPLLFPEDIRVARDTQFNSNLHGELQMKIREGLRFSERIG